MEQNAFAADSSPPTPSQLLHVLCPNFVLHYEEAEDHHFLSGAVCGNHMNENEFYKDSMHSTCKKPKINVSILLSLKKEQNGLSLIF